MPALAVSDENSVEGTDLLEMLPFSDFDRTVASASPGSSWVHSAMRLPVCGWRAREVPPPLGRAFLPRRCLQRWDAACPGRTIHARACREVHTERFCKQSNDLRQSTCGESWTACWSLLPEMTSSLEQSRKCHRPDGTVMKTTSRSRAVSGGGHRRLLRAQHARTLTPRGSVRREVRERRSVSTWRKSSRGADETSPQHRLQMFTRVPGSESRAPHSPAVCKSICSSVAARCGGRVQLVMAQDAGHTSTVTVVAAIT